jgi:hypothetical protein
MIKLNKINYLEFTELDEKKYIGEPYNELLIMYIINLILNDMKSTLKMKKKHIMTILIKK